MPARPFPERHQALVVLDRKFGVDRQPDQGTIALPWQADGEIDPFTATRSRRHVGGELVAGQELLQQCRQLHFAPGAARLDIAQHSLEVTDAGGQRLHLAKAAMDLLQPFADQLE